MTIDFVVDYEGLSATPDGIVLELGAVAFENNPNKVPNFKELVDNGFRCKFNIKSQKGRFVDPDTVAWWKKQSDEAKKVLIPSADDVTLAEGHRSFFDWLEEMGYTQRSHMYVRGPNYDAALMIDVLKREGLKHAIADQFWKFRDIRTRIEADMGVRDQTKVPLLKGTLPGFVHHSGIDDCAKDAIMIVMGQRYAYDLDELPDSITDCEEVSV